MIQCVFTLLNKVKISNPFTDVTKNPPMGIALDYIIFANIAITLKEKL